MVKGGTATRLRDWPRHNTVLHWNQDSHVNIDKTGFFPVQRLCEGLVEALQGRNVTAEHPHALRRLCKADETQISISVSTFELV